MEIEAVQELMAACHEAKRITELLPKLPKGMTPRHIGVIDAIHGLSREGDVCVSAVSARLGITRPSVTRLIGELEQLGAVGKQVDTNDKRVVWVSLTALGQQYYDFYVFGYHSFLAECFEELDPADLCTTAETIRRVYQIMRKRPMESLRLRKTEPQEKEQSS
ncbi:MarR family transcriptional regulator [bacterium 210917-DFI.7.65]|nr:MarR family transcriptional regulator [bacterium 210917-DFI.7.65]